MKGQELHLRGLGMDEPFGFKGGLPFCVFELVAVIKSALAV